MVAPRLHDRLNRLKSKGRISRFSKDERGQALVEFALTAPILLLLLAGILNFGYIMFTYLNMNITTQEASRLSGLGQNDCQVGQYIWEHLALKNADKLVLDSCSADATTADTQSIVVDISPDDSVRKSGDYVTVTVNYSISNLTPILNQFLSPLNLISKSTIRVE